MKHTLPESACKYKCFKPTPTACEDSHNSRIPELTLGSNHDEGRHNTKGLVMEIKHVLYALAFGITLSLVRTFLV